MSAPNAAPRLPLGSPLRGVLLLASMLVAVAAAYAVAGRLALLLAVPPGFASAVWPSAGIALAAQLALDRRAWAGVLLGSFALNAWLPGGGSLDISLGTTLVAAAIGAGAAVQAVLGACCFRRDPVTGGLPEGGKLARALLLAGPCVCVVNATIGVGVLYLAGEIASANAAFNWWTWWVGDAIGVLVFTPVSLVLIGEPRAQWRSRAATVAGPLLATFALVVAFFLHARRSENEAVRMELARETTTCANALAAEASNMVEVLHGVERFFASSNSVDVPEFSRFVMRSLRRRPGLAALAWTVVVRDQEIASFVARHRRDFGSDFTLTEYAGAGEPLRPVTARAEHVVVSRVEPLVEHRRLLGFDLASEPVRREALLRSRDTGLPIASAPVRLSAGAESTTGLLVFLPHYRPGAPTATSADRRTNLVGFVVGVIGHDDLAREVLGPFARSGLHVDLVLADAALGEGEPIGASIAVASSEDGVEDLCFHADVPFAGRKLQLAVTPTQEFLAARRPWHVWLVLAGGVTLVGMLGLFLLALTGSTLRISEMVRQRTESLARANEALRASEERFELAVTGASVGIWDWNVVTGENWFSPRWLELLGHAPGELPPDASSWEERLHPDDKQAVLTALREHLEIDARFDVQYRLRCKDGNYRWFHGRGQAVRDEHGKAVRMAGSLVDITERKRAESRIAKASAAAREQLEAASRAKSEFLANMSHELRTPMTAILGFAERLTEEQLSEAETKEAIATIRRNGDHLLSVVNDILDLSKIEAGKLLVEQIGCSPARLVTDVLQLLRIRASEKGLSLRAEAETPIPAVIRSDPTRLRQILLNLVGNAIKFTSAGQVTIRLQLEGADTESPSLVFRVVDTGMGMSEEHLQRLFQAFQQGDLSTTRRFGGTGLGLAISRKLALLLGGDLHVESEAGKGTTVTVRVATGPILDQPTLTDLSLPPAEVRPKAKTPQRPLPYRILLAEDGADNQLLVGAVLRRHGASVTFVSDGEAAVMAALEAKAHAEPFDLVLMDMQMPVLDGYGATKQLRSAGYRGPIVALTANVMLSDRERCRAAGCDDFVGKPIDRQQLVETIHRQVEARSGKGAE